ncbi:MAG TPA: response regulator transcription factor [Terriglobales bacterium]|nr:response regulator transcription factor [Terriglobales bacterium]
MDRILIVGKDPRLKRDLERLFVSEGLQAKIARTGKTALLTLRRATPSAILLDSRGPETLGLDLCRELRRAHGTVPIMILSSVSRTEEKVRFLELGADDYITKPYSPTELLARIRAAVRRQARNGPEQAFTFGDVTVDFQRMEVKCNSRHIRITAQEFKALKYLVQNAERVIPRDELLNAAWRRLGRSHTRTVDTHICKLRQKLEKDPANPRHFKTLYRAGYKFVP